MRRPLIAGNWKMHGSRAETRLGTSGRIVLRPSGTEPVIRVMVEGSDDKLVREIAKELAASVASAAKAA